MQTNTKKEVSCKVFTPSFEVLKRKNIDLNLALKNIPYSLDHLLNRHERIEWSVLCNFVNNIRPYLSISDFEEMGAVDIRDGFNQEYVASGLLMFSLNKFSKRDGENIVKSGEHNVTCIKGEIVSTDNNCMKLKYYIDEEHEYFPEFVYVQRGGLFELGKLFGYKEFNVETIWVHNGAIFEVTWKNKRTFLNIKKWFFWIFNFRKAFLDLSDSRTQLLNQYNKLEESKILIQKNAIQLKTAHEISKTIRQSLDISKTLNTISETLINNAGFSYVYIKLFKDIEGNNLEIESTRKSHAVNTKPIKKQIIINNKEIGELTIYPKVENELSEYEELLKYILPIINISIHDSLVLRSIMDYKNNLEEKVINRTVELEKAKDDLSNTNNLLKAAHKVQSNFFANISHEFRTPLTLILGPVKQMIERTKDQKIKDDLNMVHRNAYRLLELVNQLLDISKIESGNMKLQTIEQNIVPLLKASVLSFSSYAERKNITLTMKAEDEVLDVYLDKDKFEKIINNLLSNAFKFTPPGGKIEVAAKPKPSSSLPLVMGELKGGSVQIIIVDTGIGIPKEKLSKIFDRFYQVDSSHTREQEGTGIGLALTKELIDLHKGNIEVESEEGRGTTVIIEIPLGKDHLKPDEIIRQIDKQELHKNNELEQIIPTEGSGGKHKIIFDEIENDSLPLLLIVEDNVDVRSYIKNNFNSEFRIIEAKDGEDGWNKSIAHIPDLILSDVMMPKLDGFKLCEKLKTDERTSHIPVILLTAKAAKQDKLDGYELGADDYIMKPFDTDELKSRIKNLINQRERIHQHFKQHGLIELNIAKITPTDRKFLQTFYELIIKNISDPDFGIDQLVEKINLSRSVLHRKIVSLIGETPGELIRRTRINKAAELIETKFGNLSEIALEVGFNNPAYFSEVFKKQFGVTPSQYQHKSSNS